jgi:hypothetical protein
MIKFMPLFILVLSHFFITIRRNCEISLNLVAQRTFEKRLGPMH